MFSAGRINQSGKTPSTTETMTPTRDETDEDMHGIVCDTASEDDTTGRDSLEDDSSSAEETELSIIMVAKPTEPNGSSAPTRTAVRRAETHEAQRADGTKLDEVVGAAERAVNKCSGCSSRKVKSCVNRACKRCCVRIGSECAVHSQAKVEFSTKDTTPAAPEVPKRSRKLVLKNEFKESNVVYYDETVTLFCVRDFFQAKKLSQPLLNDQTRCLRVNGSSTGHIRAKRRVANTELKKLIVEAVDSSTKRRKAKLAVAHS